MNAIAVCQCTNSAAPANELNCFREERRFGARRIVFQLISDSKGVR